MPCHRIPGGIICVSPSFRLHLGNRYIHGSFHEFCGPIFFYDRLENNEYVPQGENDPIWPLFNKWLEKYKAAKLKAKRRIK